jgi:hypothetical protein
VKEGTKVSTSGREARFPLPITSILTAAKSGVGMKNSLAPFLSSNSVGGNSSKSSGTRKSGALDLSRVIISWGLCKEARISESQPAGDFVFGEPDMKNLPQAY